ncbi:MAG: hypothetical protein HS116_25590 [Planctomycetes bacterium]|nr:hypothetical protein [Planctomycetota bacterium]
MQAFLDSQLGRILLGLALAWTVLAASFSPVRHAQYPDEAQIKDAANVTVELDPAKLATASKENFYPAQKLDYYEDGQIVWVPEKKKFEFQPIELEVPSAGLMRPAMVLPSPGPSLTGAHALPRWGDELPPILPQAPDPKK